MRNMAVAQASMIPTKVKKAGIYVLPACPYHQPTVIGPSIKPSAVMELNVPRIFPR